MKIEMTCSEALYATSRDPEGIAGMADRYQARADELGQAVAIIHPTERWTWRRFFPAAVRTRGEHPAMTDELATAVLGAMGGAR